MYIQSKLLSRISAPSVPSAPNGESLRVHNPSEIVSFQKRKLFILTNYMWFSFRADSSKKYVQFDRLTRVDVSELSSTSAES